MDRYINATNLIKNIDVILAKNPPRGNGKSTGDVVVRAALGVTKQMVQDELKVGEVRPVVHAHWVRIDGSHKCSKCGSNCIEKDDEWIDVQFGCDPVLFCPRCGAVMDEPTEDYGYFPVPEDYE